MEFKHGDAADGFDERNIDALFLDLPNPYDYLDQVSDSLIGGGQFATLLPTMNQVEITLKVLGHKNFAFIDVCEILLRHYKSDWGRLRPVDRMVAHTGYLIFARSIQAQLNELDSEEEASDIVD